ncbi:MAG: hypothetical protein FJY97_07880 [candidate division Zixibacteria bacterium]|nr:hypothetical protein [candidate division Zixibacteria bacterium]
MTRREIGETAFTILAIAALWPAILGWNHPVYQVIMGIVLVVLSALVVNKFRRIRRMYDQTKVEAKQRRNEEG